MGAYLACRMVAISRYGTRAGCLGIDRALLLAAIETPGAQYEREARAQEKALRGSL